jgi:hypothetical protein
MLPGKPSWKDGVSDPGFKMISVYEQIANLTMVAVESHDAVFSWMKTR